MLVPVAVATLELPRAMRGRPACRFVRGRGAGRARHLCRLAVAVPRLGERRRAGGHSDRGSEAENGEPGLQRADASWGKGIAARPGAGPSALAAPIGGGSRCLTSSWQRMQLIVFAVTWMA